jgi:hypothetical protein
LLIVQGGSSVWMGHDQFPDCGSTRSAETLRGLNAARARLAREMPPLRKPMSPLTL